MNKEQKIASVSTSDTPPSHVQFATTSNGTRRQEEDCYCHCRERSCMKHRPHCLHRQELSSTTLPRRICYLCEEEIPCEHYKGIETPQEPHEDINRALHALAHRAGYEPNAWYEEELEGFINSYFIAKRDLRKLLEGKKKQLSQYDDEIELHDDAWNYNLTLDDILAEIEKL